MSDQESVASDTATSEHEESVSIKDLYDLLKKEAEIPTLQSLQPDIYQKVATTLGNLKGQNYEGVQAKVRDRMADIISLSAVMLLRLRYQKLKQKSEEPMDYSKLTDEEKYILDGEKESERRLDSVVDAAVRGRPKVLESISVRIRSKQIIVRFLKPVEQFAGVDLSKYGPFQVEDVAVLPFENARSLIQDGEAVEVHGVQI